MINAEKFEKVFGYKPDTECCVLECEQFTNCPFFEELDGGCRCDSWWFQEYKENGQNNIIKEDKQMSNLKLSPPWVIYVNKITALFEKDPAIKIQYDDDIKELKLFIDGDRKYEAISALLPSEENFGGTVLKIITVPSNLKAENDYLSLIKDAFQDNPILDHISIAPTPFGNVSYVSFKKEVVQFFNDNTIDEHGICSTLYQNIAREILDDAAKNKVYFCTNVDFKL